MSIESGTIESAETPPASPVSLDYKPSTVPELPRMIKQSQFVYSVGRIEPRFPSLGVEKEFVQATGRADTAGLTDLQSAHTVLAEPDNRYLVRKLCWVQTIENLDTYVLVPRDAVDLQMLIDAVAPTDTARDVDVVIGTLGPVATPEMCNGLTVPVVTFDQIYSFDGDSFLNAIPRPEEFAEKDFRAVARELFDRISHAADNSGATDENRALNYLTVRYPVVYEYAAKQFALNAGLASIEVLPSPRSGVRRLMNVVFTFVNRVSGVAEKFAVVVDVTEEFPFLATPMSSYFDR